MAVGYQWYIPLVMIEVGTKVLVEFDRNRKPQKTARRTSF